ncbi:endonuclease/exonuclease/phosphatase family protein [Plantactinospora sonchi]|uniref:Endonuclease/exonuclease/phosphatase family protein n=1 Tax=Plantactinospora sonchi TaxID=1544735 RepID=A0ABU7RYE5_9ACTN
MKRQILASGLALVAAVGTVTVPAAPAHAATEVTVMSWNIAGAVVNAGADKWASHINHSLGEVVGLQEVCEGQVPEIEAALEEHIGGDWVSFYGAAETFSWSCPGLDGFGQATFVPSSLNPRNPLRQQYSRENCDGDPEDRAFLAVTVTLGSRNVRVFNTHMSTRNTGADSACQAPQLVAAAQGWPNAIVMGDFNATPVDPAPAVLRNAGFVDGHPADYLTVSNDHEDCNVQPTLKFDYIFFRGAVRPDPDPLVPMCNDASDHRALVSSVTVS